MAPRIKIEDTSDTGEKITLTIEGPEIDETKLLQLIQALKAIKGEEQPRVIEASESMKARIWRIIVENFGDGTWFSLRDLHNVALKEMPDLKITAVSTYVSRLVAEGKLIKRGTKPNTRYRVYTSRVTARV
ncbi:hypothetical protein [Thermofilum pendens]|uniref:Uncharacterized protein n=1 Tax=Thermofilum pendens (strain DSM 2475 / Hrk 5) TaxID=368408 RepID=A1RXL3_THEPD|nr:hypothetical protein [Thermofilum pendens]ABL77943.1 hypothetical protein Tpen_0537 [Thermofilum pendens Hrk 5]